MGSNLSSGSQTDRGEESSSVDEPALSRVRSQRRRRILDSALQTFLREGFQGATMERVAEDAEVSKQTLYNYFVDKEDLFAALVEDHKIERIRAALEPAFEAVAAGNVEEGLRAAVLAMLGAAGDPSAMVFFRMLMEVAAESPALKETIRERIRERVFQRSVDLIGGALERGAAAGRLRRVDSEVAARMIYGAIAAYLYIAPMFACNAPHAIAPERMAASLADLLSRGLLPRD